MGADTKGLKAPKECLEATPEKRTITGVAGFALMRLAKKAGMYEWYKGMIKDMRSGIEIDEKVLGLELMFGISERITDCEKEFWEAAAILYGKSVDEVKLLEFSDVLSAVVPELMEPGMISFFTKTQAGSGK